MKTESTWKSPQDTYMKFGEMVLAKWGDVVLPTIHYTETWWDVYNGDFYQPEFETREDMPDFVSKLTEITRQFEAMAA